MDPNSLLKMASRLAARSHLSWSAPKGGWSTFHVSKRDLGENFTFTPRIPENTDELDSEDFTTPRVCVSGSLDDAMAGLFGELPKKYLPQPEVFVYATKSSPDLYVPNSDGKPEDMPGNPFNIWWSWKKYAESKNLDPNRHSKDHGETVEGCAPDAQITGELWSLKPITMKKIGRIWNNEDGDIRAKWLLKSTIDEE